jgi:hypothetical protein
MTHPPPRALSCCYVYTFEMCTTTVRNVQEPFRSSPFFWAYQSAVGNQDIANQIFQFTGVLLISLVVHIVHQSMKCGPQVFAECGGRDISTNSLMCSLGLVTACTFLVVYTMRNADTCRRHSGC